MDYLTGITKRNEKFLADLPPFQEKLDCLKCGQEMNVISYHAPILPTDFPEYLLWRCTRCGAQQLTKCKDATHRE